MNRTRPRALIYISATAAAQPVAIDSELDSGFIVANFPKAGQFFEPIHEMSPPAH